MIYILINLAGLFGVLALSRAIYRSEKTLATFSSAFSVVWGISLLINMTYANGLVRVSTSTLVVLYGAWWALLIGALIVLRLPLGPVSARADIARRRAFYALGFLLVANVCALYFDLGVGVAIRSTSLSELTSDLAVARMEGELLGTSPPLFLGIFRFAYVLYIPLLVIMRRKKWVTTPWFIMICVASGIACLTHFTRAPLLGLLVILFVSLVVVFPERRSKFVLWGTLVTVTFVGGFVAMQTLLAGPDRGQDGAFNDSLVAYCGGPMKAYDVLLRGENPVQRGLYSADMINYPLHRMGLIRTYPPLVKEEVLVPFPTNVYTFLDVFTLDFGLPGAILGAFGIGVLVAAIYRTAGPKHYLGTTLYCLTTYYLVMAGLNNEFIRFNFPVYVLLAWLIQLVICPRARTYAKSGSGKLEAARIVNMATL